MRKRRKPMTDAERMEAHAEALMRVPSGEQFIAAIQSIISIALSDLARWMQEHDGKRTPPREEQGQP